MTFARVISRGRRIFRLRQIGAPVRPVDGRLLTALGDQNGRRTQESNSNQSFHPTFSIRSSFPWLAKISRNACATRSGRPKTATAYPIERVPVPARLSRGQDAPGDDWAAALPMRLIDFRCSTSRNGRSTSDNMNARLPHGVVTRGGFSRGRTGADSRGGATVDPEVAATTALQNGTFARTRNGLERPDGLARRRVVGGNELIEFGTARTASRSHANMRPMHS